MKKFLLKTLVFLSPIPLAFILGILIPTTPRASKSLLAASIGKNSLLQNTPSPRIIFVGGSNLSFGLDSKTIKDSLKLNPINTAIHAMIGIKFMMDNTIEYIQKGDIVILVPEYGHYYRGLDAGSEELMRTIFDVDFMNIKHLNLPQLSNIAQFLPKYILTKFKISEYHNIKDSDIYSVDSFNQYGDTYTHLEKEQEHFEPYSTISGDFNDDVLRYFEKFNIELNKKGASLYVSFPCYQEASYNNSINQIRKVQEELRKSKLQIIGSAEKYKMPDSLLYNTPYHLNKKGIEYRTMMMIEDIKKAQNNKE